MRKVTKTGSLILLLVASLWVVACAANVGVGVNVGVPIGDHGYVSVGSWF